MNQPAFPTWIRRTWPSGASHQEVKRLMGELHLHTVCQSAHCPNQGECWSRRTATFMILGNVCSRNCHFCAVQPGRPSEVDLEEPDHVAEAIKRLALRHVVITSVTRDDLPDGGAEQFAQTIAAIRAYSPETTIEVLTPDFDGDHDALKQVLDAAPEVFSHNIETVARLHPILRDRRANYRRSIEVLAAARKYSSKSIIKSGFMAGCGETDVEVRQTLNDLLNAGCQAVSIGQYLQPTPNHYPVAAFISPEQFTTYEKMAYDLGFTFAVAGPFVRSSYRSEELLAAWHAHKNNIGAGHAV
ncbi:MAG TPA: lipoyl synthase [Candidatus Hydrogenedentes bacterium]|nr:lipoyl synthase [Candidatus Hydrogenedentota bacterium]